MPNHPNRSKKSSPESNPKIREIRAARENAGLTQTEAGALVYVTLRGWQQWEAGERSMHPAFWELFQLKLRGKA
jgi:putative transcriptional regulator